MRPPRPLIFDPQIQFDRDERAPATENRQEFEQRLSGEGMTAQRLVDSMTEDELYLLRGDAGFLDRMGSRLGRDFGWLAAGIMLKYSCATDPGARAVAMRILSVQLSDAAVARRMIDGGGRIVIIPRDRRLTDLPEFAQLVSQQTRDGRWWAHVRGVGNVRAGDRMAAAISEESLMGGPPDAAIFEAIPEHHVPAGAPSAGDSPGYSAATHEIGHAIHHQGLPDDDTDLIERAYEQKRDETDEAPALFENRWVDGPRVSPRPAEGSGENEDRGAWHERVAALSPEERRQYECYASQNDHEYFAQLGNAYLGTNAGIDARTRERRNNGRAWIAANESAEILALLDRLYGGQTVRARGSPENTPDTSAGSGGAGG